MVLENHTRRGKKLLPPLLVGTPPVHASLWHIERLPQLILLALYLENNTLAAAIETFLRMSVSYSAILKDFRGGKVFRPIRMGEHLTLEEYEKQAVKQHSDGAAWRSAVDPYLTMISSLLATNPMDYLSSDGDDNCDYARDDRVRILKGLLDKTIDSHSKPSLLIQTAAVAVELYSGNTKLCTGVDLPDLNAISDYPNTEESKHAAGFVVTHDLSVAMGMNPGQPDMTWQRQFWDSCYRLEPCEFEYDQ
jgi:hypothetical protein